MDSLVVGQTLFVSESLATEAAAEWLFSGVNALVGFEVALGRETLSTVRTNKGSLSKESNGFWWSFTAVFWQNRRYSIF